MKSQSKIEFGDFQTPLGLADEICTLLQGLSIQPSAIIEPTCGQGTFLHSAVQHFPNSDLHGFEIHPGYLDRAKETLLEMGVDIKGKLHQQDFFDHDWKLEFEKYGNDLLILGNPPWVTNSAMSVVGGTNVPIKKNFMGLRGIEARTGKSNFDISESMLINILQSLADKQAWVAMLCKTSTARKVLKYAWLHENNVTSARLFKIDSKKHFDVSVEACLLVIRTGPEGKSEANYHDGLSLASSITRFGIVNNLLVSDLEVYQQFLKFDEKCPFQWRSGLKHDCATVMELQNLEKNTYINKQGQQINLEDDLIYPLLKSTDLANNRLTPHRSVLVPQKRVNEDTNYIWLMCPRTWSYLQSHIQAFEARKSSIYNNGIPFGIFGIGDYAFAPWKVAISGLHPNPNFVVIGKSDDKPVMFDDTCYYLSFKQEHEAQLVADILNSAPSLQFLQSLVFSGAKRSFTVELLQRINLAAIAERIGLKERWEEMMEHQYQLSFE